jgi:Fe-S cluster biogenesis protein NfuA
VLPEALQTRFVEYLSPRATLAPPHPSPLAAQLLGVDGVTSVFYGPDFITVCKAPDTPWAHIKPEVFSLITQAVSAGEPLVHTAGSSSSSSSTTKSADAAATAVDANGDAATQDGAQSSGGDTDAPSFREEDAEVVGMIRELLETRIRPAIQEDGGDVEFRGFTAGGQVLLKLRGACRTCDSSTVTLKNGIENMLMHYV